MDYSIGRRRGEGGGEEGEIEGYVCVVCVNKTKLFVCANKTKFPEKQCVHKPYKLSLVLSLSLSLILSFSLSLADTSEHWIQRERNCSLSVALGHLVWLT